MYYYITGVDSSTSTVDYLPIFRTIVKVRTKTRTEPLQFEQYWWALNHSNRPSHDFLYGVLLLTVMEQISVHSLRQY